MRPPECRICDERFDPGEGGASVRFKRTPADEDWHRRSETEGFTGHPPNEEWFCAKHVGRARELSELSLKEAMQQWTPAPPAPQLSFELAIEPTGPAEVAQLFAARVTALLELLGGPLPEELQLPFSSERTWSPMDGATPPNCPFQDRRTAKYEGNGWSIDIRSVVARWNEHEVATTSVSVSVSHPSGASLFITGSQHAPAVHQLRVSARNVSFDALAFERALKKILSN